MPRIRKIAILFHEQLPQTVKWPYRIWTLCELWRAEGIEIEVVMGIGREIDADLLIPHIDLSYLPDEYWNFIQRHPNVVNRRVRDVRKRAICKHLVRPGDGYEGPVIVKTDANNLGRTERMLAGEDMRASRRKSRRSAS